MNFDSRVWKTGLVAVVATIILSVFVFRAAEWTRAINGEFVVYGQTSGGGSGGSGGGTGTAGVTFTRVIPQIAVGSYDSLFNHVTVIQVVNTGSASINVSGNFYNPNGTASTVAMTTNAATVPTFTGTLASTPLVANGVLVITAATASTGTTNWGRIVTTGSASVSSYFELRDFTTSALSTRVGVPSSANDMAQFLIPRARNVAANFDVGFAVVNTGGTAANITGVVRDAAGTQIAARTVSLGARSHTANFAREFFTAAGCAPCLGTEGAGTLYGFVTFTSASAQFAAMALSVEGGSLSSVALDRLQ